MRRAFSLFLLLIMLLLPAGVLAAPADDANCWPGISSVTASAYIVLNADTGEILVEHNIDEKRSMASTTKLITAMVVMADPAYDPARMCVASEGGIYFESEEAVRVNLLAGEEMSTDDLMRAAMIISANDAANTLAENYSGVEGTFEERRDAFVAKMNQYVTTLGANNTHFTNAIGFDHEEHYTTARDLAIIGAYAVKNQELLKYTSTAFDILGPTNMHPNGGWAFLINSNRLVVYGPERFRSDYFASYDGLKSGTTPWAGSCLVASGKLTDGTSLVGVILDGTLWMDGTDVNMATLMRAVLEEGGRVHVERHGPLVPIANTAEATTVPVPEATVAETVPEVAETTQPEIIAETVAIAVPPVAEDGVKKEGISTLTLILGGTSVILFLITFALAAEMLRARKRRKQLKAMDELRKMQNYGDYRRKPPYR